MNILHQRFQTNYKPRFRIRVLSGSYTSVAPTMKTMLFMDGTWLYYSFGSTRENAPIRLKFGEKWNKTHRIDWAKIPQIVAKNLQKQINNAGLLSSFVNVDVTRTNVFTSLRKHTDENSTRYKMIADWHEQNFDIKKFVMKGTEEKCVDISLAVEMLYMATVPNAYDIAVILTGDKDFMPALEKTRLLGKRTAICSIRNSINQDMLAPEARIRDFDVIWLDDHLDELIVPLEREENRSRTGRIASASLLQCFKEIFIGYNTIRLNSRILGIELQRIPSTNDKFKNAHASLKSKYGSIRRFCLAFPDEFLLTEEPDRSIGGICVHVLRPLLSRPEGADTGEHGAAVEDGSDREEDEASDDGASNQEEDEASDDGASGREEDEASDDGASDQEEMKNKSSYYTFQQQQMIIQNSIAPVLQNDSSNNDSTSSGNSRMRVSELRDMLRRLGLSVSGNKQQLLDRLSEHQRCELYAWSRKVN